MKKHTTSRRSAPLWFLACCASVPAHAAITGTLAPSSPTTWTPVADTGTTSLPQTAAPGNVPIPGTRFTAFDAPVTDQYNPHVAFKARLSAPATPLDNDGVWSTGNAIPPTLPSLVLREGDPTGSGFENFGFAGVLKVENLQMAFNARTACLANTSHASGNGKAIILDGAVGLGATQRLLAESPSTNVQDLRPPVINEFLNAGHIGFWAKQVAAPSPSGIAHRSTAFNSNDPATAYPGRTWNSAAGFAAGWHVNQPARIGSPSINYYADMAVFCRDAAGINPRHIDLVNEFGIHQLVARQGNLAANTYAPTGGYAPIAARFGVFHTRLMANSKEAFLPSSPLVAWQMANMTGGGTTPSLWFQKAGINTCVAYVNQIDTHTALPFTSFYALHAVPNPDTALVDSHFIFFGAELAGGNHGIYRCSINGTTLTAIDLIATDVPGFTPVNCFVGGLQNILLLDKFFSVNAGAGVLFKARTSAPSPNENVLVTAEAGTFGHSRQVRAQSGTGAPSINTVSFGAVVVDDFKLAIPEQGVWSRGQAFGGGGITFSPPRIAAKIVFTSSGTRQGIVIGD
jgi:hypothetical protein